MKKVKKAATPKIKHPFLKGLPKKVSDSLLVFGKKISLPTGKVLFRDSEKAEQFYLILKGKVNLLGHEQDVRYDRELSSGVFQTLGAGDVVGLSWVLAPYRWRFDAVVNQAADFFVIDGVRLRKAMAKDHEFGYAVYSKLVPMMNHRLVAARLKLQMFGGKPFSQAEGG